MGNGQKVRGCAAATRSRSTVAPGQADVPAGAPKRPATVERFLYPAWNHAGTQLMQRWTVEPAHRTEVAMPKHVADGQRVRSASFSLPPDLLDALRVEAGRRDVSVSALVRRVLAQTLAEWERERRAPPPEDAKDP